MAAPILVLGAPRSGTTWLAKIVDSHPDVLYRHEPDKAQPGPTPMSADALQGLLMRWAADRSPQTTTKRPFFRKSWQPVWANLPRTVFAAIAAAAARMPAPFKTMGRLWIPDLGVRPAPRIAIKSIDWAEDAAVLAEALPNSRTIFILRHPCGQVASMMRGNREERFDLRTQGTNMPFNEVRAIRFATSSGIDEPAFQALPAAAKYAWNWRAMNEPAYAALAARPNVHVVLYEALCAEPDRLVRRIMHFAGLPWHRQTEAFIARSAAYQGSTDYYAIFRNAVLASEAWRSTMSSADQIAVRSVVSTSPLARFWPDLMSPPD